MKPLQCNKAPIANDDFVSHGSQTDVLEPAPFDTQKYFHAPGGPLADTHRLLQAILDNVPDRIYFKDIRSRYIRLSKSLADHLGVEDPASVLGKTDSDLNPTDNAREHQEEQQVMESGQPLVNKIQRHVLPDGKTVWTSATKVPLCDQHGKVIGLLGINRDITEQREAQEALRASEKKLRQSVLQLGHSHRELHDFAYVASHDLQEPLRKIVVFGERLKEQSAGKLDEESCDYLERMQKAASRMQRLINDLLVFSRITTQAQPFTQVDLAETARDVVADLEGQVEQVQGRIEIGILPLLEAEPAQMRQLLQILIGNALKFRRPDLPPVVKVTAKIITGSLAGDGTAMARKLCRLAVSDNGIGFDEKYLDRIFNVFQRLHSRNEYEGTGMGLAIARKIALFHRGDITAASRPGEGASFMVTLPMTHPGELPTTGEKHE